MVQIAEGAARRYCLTLPDITARYGDRATIAARHLAMARMLEAGYSCAQIGRFFGRSHLMPRYAQRRVAGEDYTQARSARP